MLRCEILDVQGFDPAIHGMRNPKKKTVGTSQTVVMQLIVVNVD